MSTSKTEGSKFTVELKGIKLPEEMESKINQEIREVVLRNVASLDLGENESLVFRFPHGWLGIVFDKAEARIR
jgi:hypothetical protein